jgi:hypothetical protein
LADPAIAGRMATIELTVRRFFCDNTLFGRKKFEEQVRGLTTRHGPAQNDGAAAAGRDRVRLGRSGRREIAGLAGDSGRAEDADPSNPGDA